MPVTTVAVVDIGSATTHLLVCRLDAQRRLVTVYEASERTLLGLRTDMSGDITAVSEQYVRETLEKYQREALAHGAER